MSVDTVTQPPSSDRDTAVRRLQDCMDDLVIRVRDYYRQVGESIAPGLLPSTFKVLTSVNRFGEVPISVLADHLGSDKGQISRSVSELESRGLVVRTPDPEDARVRLVKLTEDAKARLSHARLPFEQLLGNALQDWDTEDIDQFAGLLAKLSNDLIRD